MSQQLPIRNSLALFHMSSDELKTSSPIASPKRTLVRRRSQSPGTPTNRSPTIKPLSAIALPPAIIPHRLTLDVETEGEDEFEVLGMEDSFGGPAGARSSRPGPRPSGASSTMLSTLSGTIELEFMNTIRSVSEVKNSWDFTQVGLLLGKGNSGTVYKAFNFEDFKIYALKRVYVTSAANRSQMLKEVNAFSVLKSEHLVSYFGAIIEDDNPDEIALVLEYMNRNSLQSVVDNFGGCADEAALARISKSVLLGLNDMHKMNLIHRDIKPGNIVLNHKGVVKITDFGITRDVTPDMSVVKPVQTFVGTQVYMSPERIEHKPYSFTSDIWSFGLSMLTLATGSLPYPGLPTGGFAYLFHTLTQMPAPSLPEGAFSNEFTDFICKCLNKDPEQRWSAEQLLEHPFVKDVDISSDAFEHWPWERNAEEKRMAEEHTDLLEIADILKTEYLEKTIDSAMSASTFRSLSESARTSSAGSGGSSSPSSTMKRSGGRVLEKCQYESIAETLGVRDVRYVQKVLDMELKGMSFTIRRS
eukprot:TRINITY_DN230_c0_g1_i1.p1 TRINITY_DN230_c0_g1~~TRINITY_DN230_c0_g1_i1.p1  ORF type:complete len:529 (-),score=137.36 TRINITY_DN230_c0_g1_i1:251-1837(-)